jgi:Peptidase family M23
MRQQSPVSASSIDRRKPRGPEVSGRAACTVIVALAVVIANGRRNDAQVVVPPSPSLDVRVPAAPTPVRIAGKWHLAYELHITNYRTVDVSLTRVDAIGGDRGAPLLASYEDQELAGRLARVGARPDSPDKRGISAGVQVVVFLWLDLGDAVSVPDLIRHRISYRVAGPTTAKEIATIEAGIADVRHDSPAVLAAPLQGGPWAALYDPSSVQGHRRALFAIDGRARIPARFAIDWVKVTDDGRTFHSDRSIPSKYFGYAADVLAVADGIVASAVDRFLEPTSPISLENEAGNYIAIDIGGGRFAFFEHLQPRSVRVKVGDRVRVGDALARVGASGSVFSGPHLHFHVSDANSPLGAEGLPFVFRAFDVLGAFDSLDAFAAGMPWSLVRGVTGARRLEMPPAQAVLRF